MGCGIGAINFYSQKVASRAENYWQESKSVVSLKYKGELLIRAVNQLNN